MIYESLTLDEAVQPGDLIFVMAGRPERKQYGLELYRAGIAPRLLLSVGRFEVSKMHHLPMDGFDELIAMRDATLPDERHFFVELSAQGVRIEKVRLCRWNTYGEIAEVQHFIERERLRRVIVVSTDAHLRRVAFTFAKIFGGASIKFRYCAVPPRLEPMRRERWWTRRRERRFVISEWIKLAGYRAILSMPRWAWGGLMRAVRPAGRP